MEQNIGQICSVKFTILVGSAQYALISYPDLLSTKPARNLGGYEVILVTHLTPTFLFDAYGEANAVTCWCCSYLFYIFLRPDVYNNNNNNNNNNINNDNNNNNQTYNNNNNKNEKMIIK